MWREICERRTPTRLTGEVRLSFFLVFSPSLLALKASAASAAAAERPKEDVHWSHGSPHSQAAAAATAADSKGLASYAHIQNVRLLETERPKSLVVVKT